MAQHQDQRIKDEMARHLYAIEVKGRPIRRGCLFWWVGSRLLPLSQHIGLTQRRLRPSISRMQRMEYFICVTCQSITDEASFDRLAEMLLLEEETIG